VKVDAFKRHALGALADKTTVATLTTRRRDYQVQAGQSQIGIGVEEGDTLWPGPDAKMDVRAADAYAYSLTQRSGAPKFRLYWPIAERDKAIAAMSSWLANLQ
jgi:hypothetical protein